MQTRRAQSLGAGPSHAARHAAPSAAAARYTADQPDPPAAEQMQKQFNFECNALLTSLEGALAPIADEKELTRCVPARPQAVVPARRDRARHKCNADRRTLNADEYSLQAEHAGRETA